MQTTGAGKMRKMIALGISNLLLLTGCQTNVPTVAEPELYFTARGNEPGWIVRFDEKSINFEGDYGATKIKVAKPEGRPSFNGMRYVTDRLTVDVTYATCADVMSGQRFAETVTVFANGKEFKGCGGRNLPPESLNDTAWTIITMNQIPALPDIVTALRFADGRVSGSSGCNRIPGTYTIKNSTLKFGDLAVTEIGCHEALMQQEAKLLSLLKGEVSTGYTKDCDLILTNKNGQSATLKLVI